MSRHALGFLLRYLLMSDFENWLAHNKGLVRDDDDRALARAAFEGGVAALARRLGVKIEEALWAPPPLL